MKRFINIIYVEIDVNKENMGEKMHKKCNYYLYNLNKIIKNI